MGRKRAQGRIQGGVYGGIPIEGLRGDAVRPTTGKVKEALFSMLGDRVVGAVVLDCFAGTGALGLEALSRGASQVTFVDNAPESLRVLKLNLAKIHPEGSVRVLRGNALKSRTWGGDQQPAHLILADPPYGRGLGEAFLRGLDPELLAEGGWVIVEHEARVAPEPEPWHRLRTKVYGESAISVFELRIH